MLSGETLRTEWGIFLVLDRGIYALALKNGHYLTYKIAAERDVANDAPPVLLFPLDRSCRGAVKQETGVFPSLDHPA
jgi:hypothetical protein